MGQSNWIYMWGALIPLIVSNVLHMVLVKKNLWSVLAKPIHARAYGNNKTWRGLVFVSLVNAVVFCIIHWPNLIAFRGWEVVAINFFIGWMYGLAYVLFELPNSWLKRPFLCQEVKAINLIEFLLSLSPQTVLYWLLLKAE
jgi:CDP-diacylglycerol--serine O-phosphatidyltransferase